MKELWKVLKSLGLINKISSCEVSALKISKTTQHDTNSVLGAFIDCYFNVPVNILKKFPKEQSKPPSNLGPPSNSRLQSSPSQPLNITYDPLKQS